MPKSILGKFWSIIDSSLWGTKEDKSSTSMMYALYILQYPVKDKWDEAMSNSEIIKPVALTYACLKASGRRPGSRAGSRKFC